MRIINNPTSNQWSTLSQRPKLDVRDLESTIATVFEAIKQNGDEALKAFTQRFDGVELTELEVSSAEWETYNDQVDEELKRAIRTAATNIELFHRSQQISESPVETTQGVQCWRKSVPIQRVGMYIPGGTAPLFSTVLMLGIPATIAACSERILCTPPDSTGKINPAIAYAAKVAGVQRIFKAGGAQAIAAMAQGTETIPTVDKLFGPGNQYVTAAKIFAQRLGIAIDMPAGPSEVLVAADNSIPSAFVAADLLAQAEHGTDSQVVFVTDCESYIDQVVQEVECQLSELPRAEIAIEALNNSLMVVLDSMAWSGFINTYAPEHLIVMGKYEDQVVKEVVNAGSVFIGPYSAESFGDYASGTNHTLPTTGFARAYSGVSLDSFIKKITYQKVTAQGLQNLGKTVTTMAETEGLQGHANAVNVRLKNVGMNDVGSRCLATPQDIISQKDSTNVSNFIRPEFQNITPYSSARNEFEGEAAVFLDANENGLVTNYNRYPDPLQRKLKQVIANLKGINAENLFLGNGSDEVLDLIMRLIGRPELDQVAYLNPSYGMYSVLANLNRLPQVAINLDQNFTIQPIEVLQQAKGCKLLILCNPNNPTGKIISRNDLIEIVLKFQGVVVVDEAYIDFCSDESLQDLVNTYSNLIVVQTLSKSYGMAGLRIGMAIANDEWINALNSIKPPYNLSSIVQEKAIELLQKNDWDQVIGKIQREKERVKRNLEICEKVLQVIESEANFILFQVENATKTYEVFAKNGLIVRNRSVQYGCDNMLRVSIGSPEENDQFIQILKLL